MRTGGCAGGGSSGVERAFQVWRPTVQLSDKTTSSRRDTETQKAPLSGLAPLPLCLPTHLNRCIGKERGISVGIRLRPTCRRKRHSEKSLNRRHDNLRL